MILNQFYIKVYGDTMFKVGDFVKLKEGSDYPPSKYNPKIGSWYECSGTVVILNSPEEIEEQLELTVQWGNNAVSNYYHTDLIYAFRKNNLQIQYNSIW